MIIYPAIDLKNGQCVRLYKGDMDRATIYNDDPAEQAKAWEAAGFQWIHVVDLDGAVGGAPQNARAVRDIIQAVNIPVQLGGGIRSMAQIRHWIKEGVSRVIMGTAAVRDPDLVIEACAAYPGQIAVGIDARHGVVAVDGWTENSDIDATALVKQFEDIGVAAVIYTDINRDGTGEGVNVEATKALSEATSIPVIASGGVGSRADIEAVRAADLPGVIVGKALYDGRVVPADILKAA